MVIIVTIISFMLQFLFNCFLYDSIFIPLTILVTLVILEPYFDKKSNVYFVYAFVIGLFYDFLYTNTIFLNSCVFIILAYILGLINHNITNNIFRLILDIVITIILYRFMFMFLYFVIGMTRFDFYLLFESIYKSLVFNIIYGLIFYYGLYFLSKKYNIKRI